MEPVTELFSQPGCGPCIAVERELKKHGIEYVKHNIRKDPNAAQRLRDMGYTSTPVTVGPDGRSFPGFNRARIKALLDG